MEIDKKIILKLIQALEDLKKSIDGKEIINTEAIVEEKIDDKAEKLAKLWGNDK